MNLSNRSKFTLKLWGQKVGNEHPRTAIYHSEVFFADSISEAKRQAIKTIDNLIKRGELKVGLDFFDEMVKYFHGIKWSIWNNTERTTDQRGIPYYFTGRETKRPIGRRLASRKRMNLHITLSWYRKATPADAEKIT